MAERYIRARERTPQGNLNRMERQKQYVKALMKKAMEQIKKNPESILDIYNSIKNAKFYRGNTIWVKLYPEDKKRFVQLTKNRKEKNQ